MALFTSTRRYARPQFVWGTGCDPAFSLEESRSVAHQILFHRTGDHVDVAVVDIGRGQTVAGVFIDTDQYIEVVSLGRSAGPQDCSGRSLDAGAPVIEYGTQIGLNLDYRVDCRTHRC